MSPEDKLAFQVDGLKIRSTFCGTCNYNSMSIKRLRKERDKLGLTDETHVCHTNPNFVCFGSNEFSKRQGNLNDQGTS